MTTDQQAAPMTVRVTLTVPVDRAAWETNYGTSGARETRQDVQRYVESLVREQLDAVGVLAR